MRDLALSPFAGKLASTVGLADLHVILIFLYAVLHADHPGDQLRNVLITRR